ncbi:MAG TPA: hypothetical protein EYP28_04120 [Methanophagales archaeon]|nr:hypothetical protein [Methanophagales archaeon]
MEKINIALVGYGNVGRGVEGALKLNYDEYNTEVLLISKEDMWENHSCARAAFRLSKKGHRGAFTMLDIPPGYLSPHSTEILRKS